MLSSKLIVDVAVVALNMAHKGLLIGDGGAFEKRQFNICTNAR